MIRKLVREKSARRLDQFGLIRGTSPIRENGTGVGVKKSNPIKMV